MCCFCQLVRFFRTAMTAVYFYQINRASSTYATAPVHLSRFHGDHAEKELNFLIHQLRAICCGVEYPRKLDLKKN